MQDLTKICLQELKGQQSGGRRIERQQETRSGEHSALSTILNSSGDINCKTLISNDSLTLEVSKEAWAFNSMFFQPHCLNVVRVKNLSDAQKFYEMKQSFSS